MSNWLKFFTFFIFLECFGCNHISHEETFIDINPKENNEIILKALKKNEQWIEDPMLILKKFYGCDYLIKEQNICNLSLVKDSADHYTATVFQEGYRDNPVYGIKVIVNLRWYNGSWGIQRIREAYKCNKGHGKAYYSKDSCR